MSFESNTGLNVPKHYGPRFIEKSTGNIKTEGRTKEVSIRIDPEVISNGGPVIEDLVIPAKSVMVEAYVDVTEAFALGGTTPTIEVGTDGSEATNGVTITEAQAEAVGTYDVSGAFAGTWTDPLAADTTVGVALGGTSPTVTEAGDLKLVLKYVQVA